MVRVVALAGYKGCRMVVIRDWLVCLLGVGREHWGNEHITYGMSEQDY